MLFDFPLDKVDKTGLILLRVINFLLYVVFLRVKKQNAQKYGILVRTRCYNCVILRCTTTNKMELLMVIVKKALKLMSIDNKYVMGRMMRSHNAYGCSCSC